MSEESSTRWKSSKTRVAGSGGRSLSSRRKVSRTDASGGAEEPVTDRKSTRLNSSHVEISYAGFCLEKRRPMHEGPGMLAVGTARRDLSILQIGFRVPPIRLTISASGSGPLFSYLLHAAVRWLV